MEKGNEERVIPRECRCPISTLTSPAEATDFVFAPLTLERMIITGFLLCLDSFLFMCTILPVRFVLALATCARNVVMRGLRVLPWARCRRLRPRRLHAIQKIDLFRIVVLVSAAFFVQKVQVSFFIAFIKKGLSKMRMMVMFVEVIDRVLIDFGSSILGSAYWRLSQRSISPWRLLSMYLMGTCYLVLHASFLIFHACIFDVSVALGSNALISLLVLIQFAEMKSDVMKKHTCEKLTSIVHSDIVERFQISVMLLALFCIKAAENYGQPDLLSLLFPIATGLVTVYISELLCDWIKHMSIINYSGLSPHSYTEIGSTVLKSLSRSHTTSILTDRSFSVAREIGMFPMALTLFCLRAIWDIYARFHLSFRQSCLASALLFAVMFLLKLATFNALERFSKSHKLYRRMQKIPTLSTMSSMNFYKLLLIKPPNYKEAVHEHRLRNNSIDIPRELPAG